MRQLTRSDKNLYGFLQRFTHFDESSEGNVQICTRKIVNKTNHIAMNAKFKAAYEAPAMQVVELHPNGILCFSGSRTLEMPYDQDHFSPGDDDDWDRPGYGDVIEF